MDGTDWNVRAIMVLTNQKELAGAQVLVGSVNLDGSDDYTECDPGVISSDENDIEDGKWYTFYCNDMNGIPG